MGARADYVTRPREQIAEILTREPRFLSAAEIYEKLKRSGARVSLSTVYRTLDRLHEKGDVTSRPDAEGVPGAMFRSPLRRRDRRNRIYLITTLAGSFRCLNGRAYDEGLSA